MPLLEGPITLKWRGGEAAPPIYFKFTPSRRGIFWSNILPQKTKQKSKKQNCTCRIVAIGLSPTLDYILPGGGSPWRFLPPGPQDVKDSRILADFDISLSLSLSIYIYVYIYIYSQEWEIDQLLQFCRRNFIFWIFAWFFKATYSTKICPS